MEAKEFIGKKIVNMFSDYTTSGESGCIVQQIYLELEHIGVVTIPDIDSRNADLIEANCLKPHHDNEKVKNSSITDILLSEMLPFCNFLLSNGILVFCDSPIPDRFDWYVDYFSEKYKNRYEYKSIFEIQP
jgi:hypothetical protein